MPYAGFEPTIPVSERAKTVHASDRSATVTGDFRVYLWLIIGAKSVLKLLHCAVIGDVADVSEVNALRIFRIDHIDRGSMYLRLDSHMTSPTIKHKYKYV
jgi:hypothetical protein